MIAPNKNSLYPQHMPEYGSVSRLHDGQKLLEKLNQVATVDLFQAFTAENEVLYFETDSHWNSKGAALGADLVNHVFGRDSSYFSGPFVESADYTGDLYEMLYPAFRGTEIQPIYASALTFTYTGKATQPDSITLLTESSKDGSLLVYRDSFGNLLYPYLADSYGSVRFSRSTSYDLTLEADYVLIELVERNLRYLLTNVPVMPSPVRQITIPAQSAGSVTITQDNKAPAPDTTCLWMGQVYNEADSRIYIVAEGLAYECFQTSDGFAVYLPELASPTNVIVETSSGSKNYTIN
jgi:hypothetical protein